MNFFYFLFLLNYCLCTLLSSVIQDVDESIKTLHGAIKSVQLYGKKKAIDSAFKNFKVKFKAFDELSDGRSVSSSTDITGAHSKYQNEILELSKKAIILGNDELSDRLVQFLEYDSVKSKLMKFCIEEGKLEYFLKLILWDSKILQSFWFKLEWLKLSPQQKLQLLTKLAPQQKLELLEISIRERPHAGKYFL